ncbi:MAG: hypothetical protein NT129_01080 [Candidatus Aenigmarchaeota archaeon]|nr:hypothetical protein [Candidatus Aenigmarchaeota archaeon]
MYIIRKIFVVFIFIFAALFIIGSLGNMASEQCSEIGTCKACWNLNPKSISSDLCPDPNQTCIAQPYQVQHNALVDLVLCGCAEAYDPGSGCLDTNKCNRIKGVVKDAFGPDGVSIMDICSGQSLFLTKFSYG